MALVAGEKGRAQSVDIRGARGPNAVTINGQYDPTDELCNDWPVYKKRGDPNKWLEFFDTSSKWYIKATTDKGRPRGWMRLTANPPKRPEECSTVCEVWDGSKWTSQPSVSIVTVKKRRDEDKRAGAERRAQGVPVDIRGAIGPSASSINGVYEVTSELCGGWPVYRKQNDPDKWLEYIVATNEWYVKPTADRGRAEGWMCLSSDPPQRPELSRGTCEVWDGDRWTLQSSVTVLTAACAFQSMLDVQIFFADESKNYAAKLATSLKKIVAGPIASTLQPEKVDEGINQLEALVTDIGSKLETLKDKKKRIAAEVGGGGSSPSSLASAKGSASGSGAAARHGAAARSAIAAAKSSKGGGRRATSAGVGGFHSSASKASSILDDICAVSQRR